MEFKNREVYKFNTLAPSILNTTYDLMKVKSISTIDIVGRFSKVNLYDLNSKLVNVIPGLSNNAADNTYVLFENSDKEEIVLAKEWIDSNTIEVVSSTNIRVDIPNKSTADIDVIKRALLDLGYKDLKIYTY